MQSQQINLTDMDENSSIERTMLTTPLSPTNNKGVEPNSTPVFSPEEMSSVGNCIRDNYYVAGAPRMLGYNPKKYPNANIDEIFVYWCCENGR